MIFALRNSRVTFFCAFFNAEPFYISSIRSLGIDIGKVQYHRRELELELDIARSDRLLLNSVSIQRPLPNSPTVTI